MINRVVIIGRITRDLELKKTNTGRAVISFTVACDNVAKDANGNKTASFIPVTAWNQPAEFLAKYAKKGSLVAVEGRLSQRTYQRKDGTNASVLEVIADTVNLLDSKSNGNSTNSNIDNSGYEEDKPSNADNDLIADLADDDLPF